MATDLSGVNTRPHVRRITLGLSNILTQVLLPTWLRKLTIQFITNTGRAAWTGTDGAAIGIEFLTVQADGPLELDLSNRGHERLSSVYLASPTAATVVEVELS